MFDNWCYSLRVLRIASVMLAFFLIGATPAKAPTDKDLAQRDFMVKISRQLGVTCNYCHDVSNFKSAKLPAYKIGKEHIRIVELLNAQGFRGPKAPVADCYMCHRGKAIPDYKEPVK